MKKLMLMLAFVCLVLSMGATGVLAGKPVDDDGDGYRSNVDCNDSDPLSYPGAAEICFDGVDNNCDGVVDEGCADSTCTDSDGDGYGFPADASCTYPQADCNDALAGVNPGSSEVCDNGIDDNCNGLIDAEDPACATGGGTHANLAWSDYPANCLSCHSSQASGMFGSVHYQWVGAAPDMVNQPGTPQGKLTNSVNSYCINILGDWKICGKCHVGRGMRPDTAGVGTENIDCLMCHNEDYAAVRTRLADGSLAPPEETPQATLDGFVRNLGKPTRKNCLVCHANAGGGDAVKRGDLSMATIANNDANFDVHMNVLGPNLSCQSCHKFIDHKVTGKGSDLRVTDFAAEVKCSTAECHPGMDSGSGHASSGNRNEPDRHVSRVSCQACHVDVYAKVETELHRDWRFHHDGSPADGLTGPGHPHLEKAANLVPELRFWNRLSDNYLLGDVAVMDPTTNAYPTSRPLGDIHDGKLYPFKYKTADQPMVSADRKLIALDTLVYLGTTGDVIEAIESGLQNQGYAATTPYEWVTTDTYQLINHGVAPATSVSCAKCHESGAWGIEVDSKLDTLGYQLKGPKAQICSQCHREKNLPSNHERMHGHISKGPGMDCSFCHTFSRPERNLVGPCDPEASQFVDNVPYPHQCQ
ncbi:MAG: MopE-related protein [Desulfuromonadales bacterium]|nr:MopE-related protein [Desulfuromonadales bacterium]MDW7757421.1 MopE-related protein [Desulfuromonadales bacterium]